MKTSQPIQKHIGDIHSSNGNQISGFFLILKAQTNNSLISNEIEVNGGNLKNLLFGGSAILSPTEEDFSANGELKGVKQAGQPFNTLGPHISPNAVS